MVLRVVIICFLSFLPCFSWACDFDDSDGPDVALVLSGGGAKASTQVGVMQLMEELEIPIHCITGTSMGSVVGALYASGYSADEIADIFTENDWGKLFRGDVPRRDKSFVEKEREESYYSGNVAGIDKGGLVLPGGINSMQGLKSFYRSLLLDVPVDASFDELEIPFRAVATDLHTGEAKAFAQGDIVDAILASMAVPGVFAPREIDGSLYVDGGIASTLPVKTALDMGADIIIALDVSVEPQKPNANISVAGTIQQLTTLMVWKGLQQDVSYMDADDILIRPNSANIGTAAYDRSAEGVKAGRSVGETYRQAFLEIKKKAAPSRKRKMGFAEMRANSDAPITLKNKSPIYDTLVLERYNQGASEPSENKKHARNLRDLASFGGFGEVDLVNRSGDTVLTVQPEKLGRNLLQIGFNATSDFEGLSTYSALARLTRKPLSRHGGDISLAAEFGTNIGVGAELYQPFGKAGQYFLQPSLFARWEQQNLNIAEISIGEFWTRNLGLRARLGREIGQWGVVALETEVINSRTDDLVTIIEDFEAQSTNRAAIGLYFASDTLDRTDWPTQGYRVRLRATQLHDLKDDFGATERYEALALTAFSVKDIGVILNGRYGKISSNNEILGIDTFQLGGFRQLGDFSDNSLPVNNFIYGSAEVFHRLSPSGQLFELPLYIGMIGEIAEVPLNFFELDERAVAVSGTLYFGADTPIGPLFLGTSYGSADDIGFFFKLGRTF